MSKRKLFREMDELEEQEILMEQDPVREALEHFFAEGLITEVLYTIERAGSREEGMVAYV